MAFAVPLAIIPGSYNSALIKLLVFTLGAGLLLLLLGLKMIRDPFLPENLPVILLLLIPAVTALHLYAPSNPGVTRMLLVSSAVALFISIRSFSMARRKILIPLLTGGTFAILVTLLMPSSTQRLAGVFSNANLLGSFTAGLLPAGFAFLFGRGWKRISLIFLFTVICGTALYLSGTRSSVIALAGGVTAVLFLRWKPELLKFFILLFLLAVGILVFLPQIPVPEMEGTPGVRQVIWEGTSEMFLQKPILGWGSGSFQLLFPRFRASDFLERGVSTNTVHAHSEPLEILAENGLIGFILLSALMIVLLKQGMNCKEKTITEWGVITAVAVLLLEGLTSVALRWTTSVYLLAMLASLLPARQPPIMKKLPRWTAILPIAAGILLLLPGGYKAYRMTRSSILLNSAMTALSTGEADETAREFCVASLRYNSWELGSWYTLGNIYGQEASSAADVQTAVELLESQLDAYDSLAVRAGDFAWMRVNRIDAFLKLGQFNRAMDDVIYIYRHRNDLKDFCLEIGYSITPLVSPGRAFEFMNLVFLDVLVDEAEIGWRTTGQRAIQMESSILTTFALAAVHAPEAVDGMKQTADSILTTCSDSLRNRLMISIEMELQKAESGYDLLERYIAGDMEGLEEECLEVLEDETVYAAFHRVVLCLAALENPNSDYAEMSYENSIVLAQACYPLVSWYPGAGELFLAAAVRSGGDHVLQYFKFACEIDSYGMSVMNSFRNCYVNQPPVEALKFWYANGGPHASITFVSPTGLLVPDGETRKLLQLASAESTVFRITTHFILSSLAASSSGADSEFIVSTAILRLLSQQQELAEVYGEEEAERTVSGILNREIEYLKSGHFRAETEVTARQLRSAFQSGII
ncbi:MAG: O-antigen ligase family protein [Candidatus Sabulitectum sp.]|nr:O-antigen ligase family protein [Candidatus Sabulitectum sp.]